MNAATELAVAIVLGGALAVGILLLATRVPRLAAPTLARRIAPYLRDLADPRGLTPIGATAASPFGVREGWRARRDRLLAAVGGTQALVLRLRRAGWEPDPVAFRARQLAWALSGVAVGAATAVLLAITGRPAPAAVLLGPILGAVAALGFDGWLTAAVRRRRVRVQDELPTVLEFLALCLSAGESLRDALRRVGDVGSGELTGELRRAVVASGTGSNLADALTDVATSLDVPALSRAIDHLVAAIERGAPLAQVLHDQASDARDDAKRTLIEQAGHKEIVMLLPLVFLILPLSVLFAVYPGIVMLQLGVG